MDPFVFRAALRATARIAFTASLAGCGGAVIPGSPDPGARDLDDANVSTNQDATPSDEASITPVREAGTLDSGLACSAPSPSSLFHTDAAASAVSDSMFQCCIAELTPRIAQDSGTDSPDAAAADPDVVACCGVVVFAVDHAYGTVDAGPDSGEIAALDKLGWGARQTCCDTLKNPVGPTCTPWGPPAPPAIPGEADPAAPRPTEVA